MIVKNSSLILVVNGTAVPSTVVSSIVPKSAYVIALSYSAVIVLAPA